MHEYPITLKIIDLAASHAKNAGAERVKAVHLVVGDYSGFVGESVRLYFDNIAQGTPCEGATLTIRRVEPRLLCRSCGELFKKVLFSFQCPVCGGEGGPSSVGKEFYIESIEV